MFKLNKNKIMTVGEIMKALITAEDYNKVRMNVSDEFINMAKIMLGDYEYIREKEEEYQKILQALIESGLIEINK
jgi:hypothetical protein